MWYWTCFVRGGVAEINIVYSRSLLDYHWINIKGRVGVQWHVSVYAKCCAQTKALCLHLPWTATRDYVYLFPEVWSREMNCDCLRSCSTLQRSLTSLKNHFVQLFSRPIKADSGVGTTRSFNLPCGPADPLSFTPACPGTHIGLTWWILLT